MYLVRKRFIPCLVALFLGVAMAYAEGTFRKDVSASLPFGASEELVYEGEYSRALLRGVSIAELKFLAQRHVNGDTSSANERHVRLHAEVISKGMLLKLFGVRFRQLIDSIVEAPSLTLRQSSKTDEQGDRKRTSETIVDSQSNTLVWTEREPNNPARQPRVVAAPLTGPVHDLVSVVYSVRLQRLEPGNSFELMVSDSGRIYKVPFRVTGMKKLKTVLGKVQTVCVEADIFGEGRMVPGEGKIAIWLTADPRHIPVKARINSDRGTLNLSLKRYAANPIPGPLDRRPLSSPAADIPKIVDMGAAIP